MDKNVAQKLISQIEPMINKDSGNIILVLGSSECGKTTLMCDVLLQIFKMSNGFITTYITPNFDSIPIQRLIMSSLKESKKIKKKDLSSSDEEIDITNKKLKSNKGKKYKKSSSESSSSKNKIKLNHGKPTGAPAGFKISDLYRSKEWLFTKRGYDSTYFTNIWSFRILLNKTHGNAEKVKEWRFVFALDDVIDIGGKLQREICLTWRNRNISLIQLVQDITCIDCAVRNSAPITFWGYTNHPARREQIVKGYLAPYLVGANWKEKMDTYYKLTENKMFILLNHRTREAYHINTWTGVITEMKELLNIENEETNKEILDDKDDSSSESNKKENKIINKKRKRE